MGGPYESCHSLNVKVFVLLVLELLISGVCWFVLLFSNISLWNIIPLLVAAVVLVPFLVVFAIAIRRLRNAREVGKLPHEIHIYT